VLFAVPGVLLPVWVPLLFAAATLPVGVVVGASSVVVVVVVAVVVGGGSCWRAPAPLPLPVVVAWVLVVVSWVVVCTVVPSTTP
jgi:hypothetical protein